MFAGAEVRIAGRPFHPLNSQILEAVSEMLCEGGIAAVDTVGSQTLEIWNDCRISFQYLSAMTFPPVMTSFVFPVREMPSHTIIPSPS